MLVVASILYIGGNITNADITFGSLLSVSGGVLMMYSLRYGSDLKLAAANGWN